MRTTGAARVFKRWRVDHQMETRFLTDWNRLLAPGRQESNGGMGSFLLRGQNEPTIHLSIERWENLDRWKGFRDGLSVGAAVEEGVIESADLLSTQVFDEIDDHLVYDEWGIKMIRIYTMHIRLGSEMSFLDGWRDASVAIRRRFSSSNGTLLLRDPEDALAFVEVVRWDNLLDWQNFVDEAPADSEAYEKIFAAMTDFSAEVFDELEIILI